MLKKVQSNGGPIRYSKGGWRVSKAKLRPAEVDHFLEVEKNTLGGVAFNLSAAIFRT